MSSLIRRPKSEWGKIHDISPETAGWSYVGYQVFRLREGESAGEALGSNEAIIVVIEGKVEVSAAGQDFGELGERMNVFERTPPHCLYVPNDSDWSAKATTDCEFAVCLAPGKGNCPAQRLGPDGISLEPRGKGTNTRYINNIAMEHRDVADSLLVTEVYTPQGHWSSYPPHRHDVDDYPNITYLEETYYHRLSPSQGYAHQRVWTEDGSLDETLSLGNRDVSLVPKGHHPCAAPYGYDLYYLNVMAGPMRKWRFKNHPDHEWIVERDSD